MSSAGQRARGGQALARERDLHDHVLVQRGQRPALVDHAGGVVGDDLGAHGAADDVADPAHDVAGVAVLLREQRGVRGRAGQDAPGRDLLHLGDRSCVYEEPHAPSPFAVLDGDARELSAGRGAAGGADRVEHHLQHPPPASSPGRPDVDHRDAGGLGALDQVVLQDRGSGRAPPGSARGARSVCIPRVWKCSPVPASSRTAISTRTVVARSQQVRARDVGQQVHSLDHHRRAVRDRPLDQGVEPRGDVVRPAAGSRRSCPASSSGSVGQRARRRRRTSGARTAGTRARRTRARPGAPGRWRSRARIPSRPASCVATVDLPTPVTPPSSTSSGRSRLRMFHHWRKRASTGSDSSPGSDDLLGDRAQLVRPRSRPGRWRSSRSSICCASAKRALRRQPRRHQRLGHQPLRVRQPVVAAHDGRPACGRAAGSSRRAPRRRRARSRRSSSDSARDARPGGCAGTRPARPACTARLGDDRRSAAAFSSVRNTSQPVAQRRLDVTLEVTRGGPGCRTSRAAPRPRRARPSRRRASASGRAVVKHATRAPVGQRLRRLGLAARRARSTRAGPIPPAASTSALALRAARARAHRTRTSSSERSSRSGPRCDSACAPARAALVTHTVRSARHRRQRGAASLEHHDAGLLPQREPDSLDDVRLERSPPPGPRRSAGSRRW